MNNPKRRKKKIEYPWPKFLEPIPEPKSFFEETPEPEIVEDPGEKAIAILKQIKKLINQKGK